MKGSVVFTILILGLSGRLSLSEGTDQPGEDTWKSRSVKMTESWPFSVFSSTTSRYGGTETCDAILINEKWVLVSPTCENRDATLFYFGAGNKWCNSGNFTFPYAEEVQVRKLQRRVTATQDDFDNPPWVLKLVEVLPVTLNKNVQPAKLADRTPREGEELDSTGWVKVKDEPDCHERYKVTVPRASDTKCKEAWGTESRIGDIICFSPERDVKTYSQFENNGAPLVKRGEVYGLMLHFDYSYKETDPPNLKLPMALPVYPYITWIKFITTEPWYSHLDDLLAVNSYCR